MSNKTVLCLTSDRALVTALGQAMAARQLEPVVCPTLREVGARMATEEINGLIVDGAQVRPADREAILAARKAKGALPLIWLETLATLSPVDAAPLRRLGLPLPTGFADQVRACGKPVVLLVEPGVFASRAVQAALQEAGVNFVAVENTVGLIDLIVRQAQAETRQSQAPKPMLKSLLEKLGASEAPQEESTENALGRVVVARFPGPIQEAEAFDARLRQALPPAVCYTVSGIDAVAEAVKDLRAGMPATLMRDLAGRVAGVIVDGTQAVTSVRQEKPRILFCDNNRQLIEAYAQALIPNGYDVVPVENGEAVLQAMAKGSYSLVVLGLPLAFVQNSSLEISKKLRERYPDVAIILMIEPHPLPTALQAVSQAASLGLDDALIKPVQPVTLCQSVQKALERRFLLLENARLLKEVQLSNHKLAELNGFQKKFFAVVAHDVKNPLTAILGYAEVLGMRMKEGTELTCVNHIHSAAKTLNLLISDLIDLAAIESGKLRVNLVQMELPEVLSEVRARVDVAAQQRKVKFVVECAEKLPTINGDPARLGQVIQNLSTNGIQYTKEGGTVTVRVDAAPDKLTISVIDTGIGIKKEDLPRVFERFFQTEEAQKMRRAGFGLGLKISREIIQMHGGEIAVESEFGVGSRFFFTIPVPKPEPAAAPAAPAPSNPTALTPAPAPVPTPAPTPK